MSNEQQQQHQSNDLIDGCLELGIHIPEQVAVITVSSEVTDAEAFAIPLSSVQSDYEAQAFEAARLLDQLMDGGKPPASVIYTPPKGIHEGVSTQIVAVPDLAVARAVRYILVHQRDPELCAKWLIADLHIPRALKRRTGKTPSSFRAIS